MIEKELHFSLKHHLPILIIYMKGLEIIQRKIRVLKIQGEKIMVWDMDKNAIRTYKKDNILSAMHGYVYSSKEEVTTIQRHH